MDWKNLLKHLLIWIALLLGFGALSSSRIDLGEALARAFVLLSTQAFIFYINGKLLFPKFLEQKKYLLYVVGILCSVVAGALLFHFMEVVVFGFDPPFVREMREFHELGEMHHGRGHRGPDILRMIHRGHVVMHLVVSFTTLFLSTVFANITARQKREREAMEQQNEMLEAESKFLKSQINPHFLFNSLNNIYALAQLKSDQTPDAIHRLSGLLRYVLYESDAEKVKLAQEIEYLKQYVELSLLKDGDRSNVDAVFQLDNAQPEIAPLLLIPFVENAFKHANVEDKLSGFIKIDCTCSNGNLTFLCENSVGKSAQKDEVGGVGIENVKRRLDLIYPGKHELKINAGAKKYMVELKIQLT